MIDQGGYPVFGANGIIGRYHAYNHEEPQLVVGCRGACGAVHITDPFSWITGNTMVIQPISDDIDRDYLEYFFRGSPAVAEAITGTAQPQLTQASLKPIKIPLPPLEEQKKIVAVLDQAFAALDRARASAEANLADAGELFDSWLTSVFHNHPPSWQTAKLRDLCRKITVGHVGPMAERYVESGTPFLRSQNVRPFEINLQDVKYIDDVFVGELKKSELTPGDVAIVRTGYPGTAAVIPDDLIVANCADLVIARTKAHLSPGFLALFLNSSFGKNMVAGKVVGAAQKHFNVGAAKEVDFAHPPIEEQERLVQRGLEMRAASGGIAEHYSKKLADVADLRQSLLQKSFSGQLAI